MSQNVIPTESIALMNAFSLEMSNAYREANDDLVITRAKLRVAIDNGVALAKQLEEVQKKLDDITSASVAVKESDTTTSVEV